MRQVLAGQSAIYKQFQGSSALGNVQGDDYAAYYTSMYLIQDTGEAVAQHAAGSFSPNPLSAYLEFWGVMQAVFIQQDAISELYRVVVGTKLNIVAGSPWAALRDVRNLCAGHPARRTQGAPSTQRTFMGRSFGNYSQITYELWTANGPTGAGTTTHPTFNLRQMIDDYDQQAGKILQFILAAMRTRWP